jgi:integrase
MKVVAPRHRGSREHSDRTLGGVTMSESHPTAPAKPSKPYPDFPLFAHATRRWAKKIRGQLHYFGKWDDPDGALNKYLAEKDDLHAGRKPRQDAGGALTVKALANAYLNNKQALVNAGELAPRTWRDYKDTTDLLVSHFGKGRLVDDLGPDDFAGLRAAMAKKWGPVTLANWVQRVRGVFRFAELNGLVERPVRYGSAFDRPSAKTLRLERARRGPRMFEAEEIRRMLAAADLTIRAMILLGVNCGFGNADVGRLPASALDLEGGWVTYPRGKTGIARRAALWPETVAALREALAARPEPKDAAHTGLVFITARGLPWHKETVESPVTQAMGKLLDRLGINGHRNFYALRHTFETIGGESRDQVAVDFIMGHSRGDMASFYRERISDERLKAVTEHVRAWLFPPKKQPPKRTGKAPAAGG